ncbi:MAG: MgtC/SapB family protein [Candidatus Eremiobacteraeota bacterium]|nr:MgtC/SapB family protein [Candidatus Eremiobacteraeota bacterium]
MTTADFVVRVLLALALGILIGVERQWRQRGAGLRTNALVSLGAALFSSLSILLDGGNPTQIAAYIVSGTGFLAGAVIFKENFSVRGLNTAATLWATAAVGTLVGSGFYLDATIGAVAILATNIVLRPIVQRINRQPFEQTELSREFVIRVTCDASKESSVRALLLARIRETPQVVLRAIESRNLDEGEVEVVATVVAAAHAELDLERIVGRMSLERAILAASWRAGELTSSQDESEE